MEKAETFFMRSTAEKYSPAATYYCGERDDTNATMPGRGFEIGAREDGAAWPRRCGGRRVGVGFS